MMSFLEAISPTARTLLNGDRPDRSVKNSPVMMDVIMGVMDLIEKSNDRIAAVDFDLDLKLAWLTGRVGDIAKTMGERRQQAVAHAAGAAFAWLLAMKLPETDVVARIADERLRQRQLFAARKLTFRVDSKAVGDWRKLRALVEELGEVAEAVDQLEAHPRSRQHRAHMLGELVQVAAVCVAWLESYEVPS